MPNRHRLNNQLPLFSSATGATHPCFAGPLPFIAVIVLVILHGAASALAQDQPAEGRKWVWISQGNTLDEVATEMTELYKALADADALPTRRYEDKKGQHLEKVWRDEHLFFGAHFPDPVQEIACTQNTPHCRRTPDTNSNAPGSRRWTNGVGDSLTIPDLRFRIDNRWIVYEKKLGVDVGPLVVHRFGGCKEIDESCRALLREMNGPGKEILGKDFKGLIWLPGLRVMTALDLEGKPELQQELKGNLVPLATVGKRTHRSLTRYEVDIDPLLDVRDGSYSPELRRGLPPQRSSPGLGGLFDSGLHSLHHLHGLAWSTEISRPHWLGLDVKSSLQWDAWDERELSTIGGAGGGHEALEIGTVSWLEGMSERWPSSTEAAVTTPIIAAEDTSLREMAEAQRKIFDLIALPAQPTLDGDLQADPLVVVIDEVVHGKHCGFEQGRVTAFDMYGKPVSQDECLSECGRRVASPDHGTHVAGLIGARKCPQNGDATIRGVHPGVEIHTYEIDLSDNDFEIVDAAGIVARAVRRFPQVVNLSWGYAPTRQGDADEIINALGELKHTLVVVAAGNEGDEHASACRRYPACKDGLSNFLVVAALNGEEVPDLWSSSTGNSSDYGRMRVHLGAPGEGIPSLASDCGVGRLSGTSQATPIATGAASLVYAKAGQVEPYQVRNRLIYTSDLFPTLEKKLLGGRLNVARALDLEEARVELRPGAAVTCGQERVELPEGGVLRGTIGLVSNRAGEMGHTFPAILRDGQQCTVDNHVNIRRLRRMLYRPEWDEYTLFSLVRDDSTSLVRCRIVLSSLDQLVGIDATVSDSPLSGRCRFRIGDIQDYVAPLNEEE